MTSRHASTVGSFVLMLALGSAGEALAGPGSGSGDDPSPSPAPDAARYGVATEADIFFGYLPGNPLGSPVLQGWDLNGFAASVAGKHNDGGKASATAVDDAKDLQAPTLSVAAQGTMAFQDACSVCGSNVRGSAWSAVPHVFQGDGTDEPQTLSVTLTVTGSTVVSDEQHAAARVTGTVIVVADAGYLFKADEEKFIEANDVLAPVGEVGLENGNGGSASTTVTAVLKPGTKVVIWTRVDAFARSKGTLAHGIGWSQVSSGSPANALGR